MIHMKITKRNSLVGCRRLVYIAVFLAVALDILFVTHEGRHHDCASEKKARGLALNFPPACAVTADENIGQRYRHRHTDENCGKRTLDATTFNSNRKLPRELNNLSGARKYSAIRNITRNFIFSKIIDNPSVRKIFVSRKQTRGSLRETTRLVGGANLHPQREEDPQQSISSDPEVIVNPTANEGEKSFLGRVIPKAQSLLPPIALEGQTRRNFQRMMTFLQKTTSQAGPSVLTALSLLGRTGKKNEVSLLTLYAVALLGASCGFHLFLHFITLGYALGITLPLIVALHFYQKQYTLPLPTVLHSSITILWGIRLFSFLAIREYVTWPALHQKVVEVQAKMKIPFASKILCWFVYSFFYLALVASCWSRLLQMSLSSSSTWGILGYVGLSLQIVGLLLETIADLQKSSFKSHNRHSWCNVGVWKYSTHPNYLGEGVFWWGTYLAHGFHSPLASTLATVGLVFILSVLKGSARSLSSKQKEKYGQEMDFYQFQRTHNVFGPKQLWSRRQVVSEDTITPRTQGEEAMAFNENEIPINTND